MPARLDFCSHDSGTGIDSMGFMNEYSLMDLQNHGEMMKDM